MNEVIEKVKRLLASGGRLSKVEVDALAILGSEYKHTLKGGNMQTKKAGRGPGSTNFEKFGEDIPLITKAKDLDEGVYVRKGKEFKFMPSTNGIGTLIYTYKQLGGAAQEEPVAKKGKKPVEEEFEVTYDSIMEMKRKELKTLIKDNDLETDPDDFEDDEDLKEAVCAELDLQPVKEKAKKKGKKKEPEFDAEAIMEMGKKALKAFIAENELEVDTDEYDTAAEIAEAVLEELGLEMPE